MNPSDTPGVPNKPAAAPRPAAPAPLTSGPGASSIRLGGDLAAAASIQRSFYSLVGGHDTFVRLVHAFYAGVAQDPLLRPLYPGDDLGPAEERLRMFLEQYWGGPTTYSDQRGHPRLRMRHAPFKVNPAARDAWLRHMRHAVDLLVEDGTLIPAAEAVLWEYLERAAHSMLNTFEA